MGLFDHPLTEKLGYNFAKALRQECDDLIREYERKYGSTGVASAKPPLHAPPEPGDAPRASDLAHAAEIIPLKASDLDREIQEMKAEFDQIHGWLVFRFYHDGSHTYVTFGCCHPEHLALAGAVLTQEALIECRRAVAP